jgi:hypothetical protein
MLYCLCLLLQGPDIQIKAQNYITLQNAQELVLWILANGVATAPKWAMVQVRVRSAWTSAAAVGRTPRSGCAGKGSVC